MILYVHILVRHADLRYKTQELGYFHLNRDSQNVISPVSNWPPLLELVESYAMYTDLTERSNDESHQVYVWMFS